MNDLRGLLFKEPAAQTDKGRHYYAQENAAECSRRPLRSIEDTVIMLKWLFVREFPIIRKMAVIVRSPGARRTLTHSPTHSLNTSFKGDYYCRCGQLSNSKKAVFCLLNGAIFPLPCKCLVSRSLHFCLDTRALAWYTPHRQREVHYSCVNNAPEPAIINIR
jgi:hypothetical protein